MNRIYKIIWNEALGCFTAVGEYAKGRGKSSKSSVGSSTTINTISHLSSINTLRLSAIVLGLLAAGFGMQANATGTENHHDGDYSHSHGSHGSHGVHYHTTGNNSHNNNSNPDDSEGSISLKFEGDNATTITRNNGETLNILGGATGTLTNGNIGVFGIGDTLTIQLAENIDLGADGSLKTGDTLVDSSGIKITASDPINNVFLGHGGLNNGNNIITGVAPGAINATSTDAVNGSQLYATNTAVNTNSTAISSGLNFDGDTGDTVNRQLGQTLTVKGGATNLSDNNIGVEANGSNALTVKLAKDLTGLTSVTTGDTLLNTDGVRFLGGSTVRLSSQGLDNGGNQITNVASGGTTTTNAANIGDVRLAAAAARTQVVKGTNVASVDFSTDSLTGQDVYTVNADGVTVSKGSDAVTVTAGAKDATNTTDYQVDLSDDSKASLVKADNAMQTVVTQIDGADVKTLNKTDNTANFLSGNNIVLSADGEGIKVSTADDVVFTSMTTGDTLLNTDGVRFLGGSTVRLSSQGLNNGGNRLTNVGDGTADMDAVNVRQLKATNSTVDLGLDFTGDDTTVVVNRQLGETLTIKGGAADLTEKNIGVVSDDKGNLNVRLAKDLMLGSTGSVRMESTVLNNAGITITDGPNETIILSNEGLDNGNNRIIKVAKGIAPSDAVNFAQLTTTNDEIAKGINIGDGNSANDQQFALGDTINITGDSNLTTTASAMGLQVKLNNQLDLGDAGRMQIGNSIMNNTGFTFVDNGMSRTVRLSSTGLDNGGNPIRNVGKGTLNTDAVNLEQLREVTIALDQGWGITAQGDIATMVKQGGTVDMNSRDGNITVSRTLVNTPASGLRTAAISASANDISFDLNPNINVISVKAGDTTINNNGLTIIGGPSITKNGIDAANNKVINVQDGEVTTDSQDAINGSQLYAQGSGIGRIIGGNTVYNPVDGTFTNSNIGGTGKSNIDSAIASIRQGTVEINENVQVNTTNIATNTTNIATNTTNIATNTTNIATNTTNIATNTTNIATNTANIVTNTTNIKANQDRLNAGLNFGADHGTTIKKAVGDGSVITLKGGDNVTTTAEGSSIKFDLNGNINLDSVTTGNTTINNNGVTMVGGPSMTASGINAAGNKITNVADGMAPRDAVNFGQLDAVSRRLGDSMNELGYKIGEVEDDANAGISAAMAMSSLPQAYILGKSMIGGGVGTYNGESAVAIGFSKLSNDGRWVMKLNGTADTQGNAGASIGAGFHFD